MNQFDRLSDVVMVSGDTLSFKDGKFFVKKKPRVSRAQAYGLFLVGLMVVECFALYFIGADLESRVTAVCQYVAGPR